MMQYLINNSFGDDLQFLLVVLLVALLVILILELFRTDGSALLNASATISGLVMIPLFHGMTQAEQDQVLSALESLRP